MNPLRGLLLAGSQSAWLRRQATRRRFVRRAVARFMPGESLEDALGAAGTLRGGGFGTIVTQLGENVADRADAEAVTQHYLIALDRIRAAGLDTEVSVKLTHLGLDLDVAFSRELVARIAARAREQGKRLWIDMEGSAYTDATLRLYRELRPAHPNLGVCVQSYLRRTATDVETLIGLGAAVRLVKGAYREQAELAFPRKRDVDESFFALTRRLLAGDARRAGVWLAAGTHDPLLIERITAHAAAGGIAKDAFEFALLYGIRRDQQQRLRESGHRVRVLISYGSYWFPWYMRRLAERPANVLFVMRNVFGG